MPFLDRSLVRECSVPYDGGSVNFWAYATPDAAATVTAAGYFNTARAVLKVNDVIEVMSVVGGVGDWLKLKVLTVPATGDITVAVNSEAAGT